MVAPDLNLPKRRLFKRPARFWKRALAFLLDIFFVQFIIILPFQPIFKGIEGRSLNILLNAGSIVIPPSVFVAVFFIMLLVFLYFTLFEYFLRQTIGMTIFGLFVDGEIPFWKAVVRNLYLIPIASIILILWPIELIHLGIYKTRALERITQTSTVEVFQAY